MIGKTIFLAAKEGAIKLYEMLFEENSESRSLEYGYKLWMKFSADYSRARGNEAGERSALREFQRALDRGSALGYDPDIVY